MFNSTALLHFFVIFQYIFHWATKSEHLNTTVELLTLLFKLHNLSLLIENITILSRLLRGFLSPLLLHHYHLGNFEMQNFQIFPELPNQNLRFTRSQVIAEHIRTEKGWSSWSDSCHCTSLTEDRLPQGSQ